MYKYSISMYDWEKPLNVVMKKVFNYDSLHSNVDDICIATAIVDLCRDRDNQDIMCSHIPILLILYKCFALVSLYFIQSLNYFRIFCVI